MNTFNLFNEIDRAFTPVFKTSQRSDLSNSYQVQENDDVIHLSIDVPGVKIEDLTIDVKGQSLTIEAKRRSRLVDDEGNNKVISTFHKSFRLPKSIESDSLEASLVDGVLDVILPKTKPVEPESRKVTINSSPVKGLIN